VLRQSFTGFDPKGDIARGFEMSALPRSMRRASAMAATMKASMRPSMEPVMETSMEPSSIKPAVEEAFMPEMVETIAEDEDSSGEDGGPDAPGICSIVLVGVRRDVDHLRRQRVDLRR
jgi:hypothetical protein